MPSELAVVIITYNSAQVIADLLDSLPAALGGIDADVVVVDNGSADDTVALVQQRADCQLVQSSNVGYAGGVNVGARTCPAAKTILVLNPDVRMHADSVAPLLAALELPNTGIVVPRVQDTDGALQLSLRRDPTVLRALGLTMTGFAVFSEYVTAKAEYDRAGVVDWALGAVMLLSRSCYDAVGGWDESFFLYSEETDFCLRARDLGYLTTDEPTAVVEHIGGQSGRNDKTHTMQIVNRVRFFHRRHGEVRSWAYYYLTILSELSWLLRGHKQSRAAIDALLHPSRRPSELGSSDRLLPI